MTALTATWSHHHIHDDVETALAEHTRRPDGITGWHTGRGLVSRRPWAHGHHDQSISSPSSLESRVGLGASRIGDVGGRGRRPRSNLENPSTSYDAQ